MSHAVPTGWQEEEGAGNDFLPLSRPFQNTTHTHTHTASISPRQPCPCSWERSWPRSTPGYFGKPLRTCVSCKHFSCPQLCSPRREAALSSVGAPGGAKGAVPGSQGKKRRPRNPGVCSWAVGRKQGNRGLSPYCVPVMSPALYQGNGKMEIKAQRWNSI